MGETQTQVSEFNYEATTELLANAGLVYPMPLVGESRYEAEMIARTILAREIPVSEMAPLAIQTIDTLILPPYVDRVLPSAVATLPRDASEHHDKALSRKRALIGAQNSELESEVLAVIEHTLKRDLSEVYVHALYRQGILTLPGSKKSFVDEYMARCNGKSGFQFKDRSIKPTLLEEYDENDEFAVTAGYIFDWAQQYPELLPATWDDFREIIDAIEETDEAELDLPPELIAALIEHPLDVVRSKLLATQFVTAEQALRAKELFEENKPDQATQLGTREIDWESLLVFQYKLYRRRAYTPDEARIAIAPLEAALDVAFESRGIREDMLDRPYANLTDERYSTGVDEFRDTLDEVFGTVEDHISTNLSKN